jgi:Homeodomain-like domain
MNNITICSPAPQTVFFDEFQFTHKPKVITRESGIAWSDYEHMHVSRYKPTRCPRYIPAYASDPKKVSRVLMQAAWQYCHGGARFPERITMKELRKEVDAKTKWLHAQDYSHLHVWQQDIWNRHRLAFDRPGCGGWFGVHAAIVYRSWNLGQESKVVAADLFLTPPGVRKILWGLNAIARKLGYESFPKGKFYGKSKLPEPKALLQMIKDCGGDLPFVAAEIGLSESIVKKGCVEARKRLGISAPNCRGSRRHFDWEKVLALRAKGWTYKQISKQVGCSKVTVSHIVAKTKRATQVRAARR